MQIRHNKYLISLFNLFIFTCFVVSCTDSVAPLSSSENGYNSFEKLPNSAKFESDWPKNNSVLVHILAEPDNLHPTNGTSQTRA